MIYTYLQREYTAVIKDKEDIISARLEYGSLFLSVVARELVCTLDPSAISILLWLANRTILVGKAAERVPYREFLEGIEGDDEQFIKPLQLSLPTIRKHLKALIESDIVHAHCVKSRASGAENDSRMFEINVKKIANTCDVEGRNLRLLVAIEAKVIEEKRLKVEERVARAAKKTGTPPIKNFHTSSCNIHVLPSAMHTNLRLDKSNQLLSPVFDTAMVAAEIQTKNSVGMHNLPAPKKPRPVGPAHDTAMEAIASATKASVVRRVARVAAAVSGEINTANLQAMLDTCMKVHHPELPRIIVTERAFGVMKKRIRAAELPDLRDFIEFCIREWTILHLQNRAAFIRDPGRYSKGSVLPEAPSFSPLAYRLPYFIAAYANRRGNLNISKKTGDQQRIAELESALATERQTSRNTLEVMRRTRRAPLTPLTTINVKESNKELDDDWEPPEWQEGGTKNYAKHGR